MNTQLIEKQIRELKQEKSVLKQMLILETIRDDVLKIQQEIIICERSIWTDKNVFAQMLADDGKIDDVNFTIYKKWFDDLSKDIQLDGILYLKTSPEVCQQRVALRNRKGEDIPLAYLTRCNAYHENWLKTIETIHVLDGDIVTSDISKERLECIAKFIRKIYDMKNKVSFEFNVSDIYDKMHC